jgi:hypothetical protein
MKFVVTVLAIGLAGISLDAQAQQITGAASS